MSPRASSAPLYDSWLEWRAIFDRRKDEVADAKRRLHAVLKEKTMPVNGIKAREWQQGGSQIVTSDFNMVPGEMMVTAALTAQRAEEPRSLELSEHHRPRPARNRSDSGGSGARRWAGRG